MIDHNSTRMNFDLLYSDELWGETRESKRSGGYVPSRWILNSNDQRHSTCEPSYSEEYNQYGRDDWCVFGEYHRLGGPSLMYRTRIRGEVYDYISSWAVLGLTVSKQQHDDLVTMLDRWTLPHTPDDVSPEARRLRTLWKVKTMWNRAKMRKLLRSDTARRIMEEAWRPDGERATRFKQQLERELDSHITTNTHSV